MTTSFDAVADTRVEEANPAINYGDSTRLGSDGDLGQEVRSYLRFSPTGIRYSIRSAKLRLYVVSDGSLDGPAVYPSSGDWSEQSTTWMTSPAPTGPPIAYTGAIAAGTWIEVDVTSLVAGNGEINLLLSQSGLDGAIFYSRQGRYQPELVVTSSDPVVMAAGDIACQPGAAVTAVACHHARTADLLTSEPWLTSVLMLGDGQYEDGLYSEYTGPNAYDATWGRAKPITRPTPGNHEYHLPGAPGYFDYFGTGAGPIADGLYSFDLGSWHLISLNSEISSAAGSPQEQWLRADLAATRKPCVLAYWHRPRFSSGSHGSSASLVPLWQALYDARADVVLSGHDHDYERFAPQDAAGRPAADGIRQFVIGTGGASHGPFASEIAANSEVRDASTFGVLRLVLHASNYDWTFVPETGDGFSDSGTVDCHGVPPTATVTATPSEGVAPLGVTVDASNSTGGPRTPLVDYSFSFGDGSPATGPQQSAVAAHTYVAAGTYTVRLRVTDAAGQVDESETQVIVKENMVRNAGFETGGLGWNTAGSGPGITLEQHPGGVASAWAALLTNTGTSPSSCALNDSPNWVRMTAAGGYTGSLWVRADSSGARLRLRFREWSGLALLGIASSEVVLTPTWQKAVVRYSPLAAGFSTLDFNAYVPGAAPGTCFYADDVVVVRDD